MAPPEMDPFFSELQWVDEHTFVLKGVTFVFDTAPRDQREKSTTNRFVLVKNKRYLNSYAEFVDLRGVRRIFELGIFRGGSTALLDLLLEPEKLVAIERSKQPIEPLDDYIVQRGRSEHLKTYYGVDQADTVALERIVDENFDQPIDLVLDDASHFYEPTKASFSVLFPRLVQGGWYVIEDWSWAHSRRAQEPDDPRRDHPALTNLIIELLMIAGGAGSIIDAVFANNALAVIRKGHGRVTTPFDVSVAYRNRGKSPILF